MKKMTNSTTIDVLIANTYNKFQSVTRVALCYEAALEALHYKTKFLQFTLGESPESFHRPASKGLYLPNRFLRKFINLTFYVPSEISQHEARTIIISDPWLLGVSRKKDNCILIFHDARQLTRYRDNIFASIFFRFLIGKVSRVKHIICVSEASRSELIRMGVNPEKMTVINSPVSISLPENINEKSAKLYPQDVFTIGYIAADQRHKNIDFFARIAREVSERSTDRQFNFILVSNLSSTKKRSLQQVARTNFTILSNLDSIDEIYEKIDLLVFPSLFEGFGLPIVEAMSHGIPVIAYDLPITREVLQSAGILVSDLLLNDWVSAILEINASKYEEMSKLSLERSRSFSFEVFLKNIEEFMGSIRF